MTKRKLQWLNYIYILGLFTIIFSIPSIKADVIIPSLFSDFSIFHLIYLIPVILIEATIFYLVVRLNIFNQKIRYRISLFIFLCANALTTAIGFLYPLINKPFYHSYFSLISMYAITCMIETPIIFLFLQKRIEKPLKNALIFSFFINIFSYIFLILITETHVY